MAEAAESSQGLRSAVEGPALHDRTPSMDWNGRPSGQGHEIGAPAMRCVHAATAMHVAQPQVVTSLR